MNREEMRKEFPETPREIRDMMECEVRRQLDMEKQKKSVGGQQAVRSMKKTVLIAAVAVTIIIFLPWRRERLLWFM